MLVLDFSQPMHIYTPLSATFALSGRLVVAVAILMSANVAHSTEQPLPPERRVENSRVVLPEVAMTIENYEKAEAEFNAPVRNGFGHVLYIIDFKPNVSEGYPRTQPPADGFPDYLKPETRHFVAAFAREYALTVVGLTSWIGESLSAYLPEDQKAQILKDSRVERVTPSRKVRLSGPVWQDSGRTSWGAVETGPQAVLSDSINVYVLDTGVGYHQDLPNVSRYGATSTTNPVGCYGHSTHVAGIVGAVGASLPALPGSQGVIANIPIVSVGVGAEFSLGAACAGGGTTTDWLSGLEWIRYMILWSNRVGVINVSANGEEWKTTGTIGAKFLQLSTPTTGYKGAFIVQSAGNGSEPDAGHPAPTGYTRDACDVSYNVTGVAALTDGVMVVGAMDANGQQVVPLAGVRGMKNTVANSQPGSNYGDCVAVYAPGKDIASTWIHGNQSSNPTPLGTAHERVSGTSMAAPHVAAAAAYIGTLKGATTPSDIEYWVRTLGWNLGSTAQGTSGPVAMWAVNLSGPKPSAKPTAVFGINGDTIDRVGANSIAYGVGFNLQYGSVGATTCTLTGYKNGVLWYQNPNFVTSYDWGSVLLDAATYRWTIDCAALSGANNTAEIQATVLPPPPPAATFYINQQPQANGSTYSYLQTSGTVYFSYGSVSESTCDLDVQKGPIGGALTPWYSYPALGSTYSWGYVSWAPHRYKYTIHCYGGPLGPVSSTLYVEAP